jgi:chemotaxis protein MotB
MQTPAPPAREKKKPNHERWVISYADLLTLLLAFFVVLYASSTNNKYKLEQEAQSLLKAFHGTPPAVVTAQSASRGIMRHEPSPIPKPVEHPAPQRPRVPNVVSRQLLAEIMALQAARAALAQLLQPLISKNEVTMQAQPLVLTINLNDDVLFATGQATLLPAAAALLTSVATSLQTLPAQFAIVVQGYTDNQPIATAQFPSNWSLSTERAISVVQLFTAHGIGGPQLSAQGFGQFAPVASNATADGRAKNRRVVIVIHAPQPDAQ